MGLLIQNGTVVTADKTFLADILTEGETIKEIRAGISPAPAHKTLDATGMNHWNVQPDILVTAKGITSAYVPLGLCATTAKIAQHFEDHYFAHGHTYEAHPLTLAPAVATIHEIQRLNLVERAKEVGSYLGDKLKALTAKHPSIGEVRGLGMFWAVDLVKNKETKEPFNTMRDKVSGTPLVVDHVAAEMMKRGVTVQAWVSHFVVAPPLIISEGEIDQGVAQLDAALTIADDAITNSSSAAS